MDTIKKVRDRLNHVKSDLAELTRPKMGKSWFDNDRISKLEEEKKFLEEKLVHLKNNS
jgi:hypothetical protein